MAISPDATRTDRPLSLNMTLLAQHELDGFGGMGEGMSMQRSKDGRRILWLAVLSHLELSFAYPMLSASYIVVLAASALVLKERVTTRQVCGVLIITLGVALVSMTG